MTRNVIKWCSVNAKLDAIEYDCQEGEVASYYTFIN